MIESAVSRRQGVSFAPAPGWAGFAPFVRPPLRPELAEHGLIHWLIDDVFNLLGREQVRAHRQVREVASPEGMQNAATLDLSFDPAFERVVLHHVRVLRQGAAREELSEEAVQVFRRETDLERAMYDGRSTIHLIIPDVRVGDIIDTSHSVIGDHPVLRGKFSADVGFQWGLPVESRRLRILAAEGRRFAGRYWGRRPAQRETRRPGGTVEHAWAAEGFPPFHYEPITPYGWTGHARLLVCDKMSWSDVADLFRDAYSASGPLDPDLEAMAAEIAAREATPAGRAAAALKRVQAEIRYLAFSLGEGGLLPRPVDQIWRSRFGDCKDVSRLLAALLTRLGVEAVPALVNTAIGRDLWDSPPTMTAFDHCIVRVRLAGRSYWLDATRPTQAGRLEVLEQPRFGYALPLTAKAGLEPMGEGPLRTVLEVDHDIAMGPERASAAEIKARTVFRGWRADEMRRRLRAEGITEVRRTFVGFYEKHFGSLRTVEPLSFSDNEPDNELTASERHLLLEPWRASDDGGRVYFQTLDEVIAPSLSAPSALHRTQPIGLGEPRRVTQKTVIRLPIPWNAESWDETWRVDGAEIATACRRLDDGRRIELASSLQVTRLVLPPDKAKDLETAVDRGRRSAAITLSHDVSNGQFAVASGARAGRRSGGFNWWWLVWMLLALAVLGRALTGG